MKMIHCGSQNSGPQCSTKDMSGSQKKAFVKLLFYLNRTDVQSSCSWNNLLVSGRGKPWPCGIYQEIEWNSK